MHKELYGRSLKFAKGIERVEMSFRTSPEMSRFSPVNLDELDGLSLTPNAR